MSHNKTVRVMTAALLLFLPAGEISAAVSEPEEAKIDWPTFMRQHVMTFDKLPGGWTEARSEEHTSELQSQR
jgi:hypothetical protein